MINTIILCLAIILAITLTAINPFWGGIFLFAALCFFVNLILRNRCRLLIGKTDCELWDIYKMKEDNYFDRIY